jgi:hypothetical protein
LVKQAHANSKRGVLGESCMRDPCKHCFCAALGLQMPTLS